MSRFWVHHLQCPHFPSASLPFGKTWNEGPGENTIHHLPLCPADLGPKDAIVEFFGEAMMVLLWLDLHSPNAWWFFCSNRTLSVSVVWMLFVHDDNQMRAPWLNRERERACSYNYIHIYTMQYRRINSLFIWIWHHIFVYITGVHCPWTAYAHFSMALPFLYL